MLPEVTTDRGEQRLTLEHSAQPYKVRKGGIAWTGF